MQHIESNPRGLNMWEWTLLLTAAGLGGSTGAWCAWQWSSGIDESYRWLGVAHAIVIASGLIVERVRSGRLWTRLCAVTLCAGLFPYWGMWVVMFFATVGLFVSIVACSALWGVIVSAMIGRWEYLRLFLIAGALATIPLALDWAFAITSQGKDPFALGAVVWHVSTAILLPFHAARLRSRHQRHRSTLREAPVVR